MPCKLAVILFGGSANRFAAVIADRLGLELGGGPDENLAIRRDALEQLVYETMRPLNGYTRTSRCASYRVLESDLEFYFQELEPRGVPRACLDCYSGPHSG
jgi:hypothetical protein